jgi:hypothetical protein
LQLARRGKGKSGGYRIVTFYSGETIPVFLITAFSKGEKADLSQRERDALEAMTKEIVATYKHSVVSIRGRK